MGDEADYLEEYYIDDYFDNEPDSYYERKKDEQEYARKRMKYRRAQKRKRQSNGIIPVENKSNYDRKDKE